MEKKSAAEALRGNTAALALLVVLAVAGFVAASWPPLSVHSLLDLDVYRSGGATWLAGRSLYDQLLPALTLHLPFTYPPFSAILMSPLALVGMPVAAMAMTAMSIAALIATGFLVWRAVALEAGAGWAPQLKPRLWSAVSLLIAVDVSLLLEPVASTLSHGQINVLLMAMVIADAACIPRWRGRGILVGLAAAIKLTPAIFVLYFLLRRDYRAATTSFAAFVLFGLIGFALAFQDSIQYWTRTLFNTDRIGYTASASNQSITGALARLGFDGSSAKLAWVGLSLLAVVLAVKGANKALSCGRNLLALTCIALCGLLASPISWSHHWVWILPAVYVLATMGLRERKLWPLLLSVLGLFIAAAQPEWWLPNGAYRELGWTWWQQIVGNAYVLWAFLTLGLVAVKTPRSESGSVVRS
jgi:alpha-1,2-mannosyltransferase